MTFSPLGIRAAPRQMRAGRNIAPVFASGVPDKIYRLFNVLPFISHAGTRQTGNIMLARRQKMPRTDRVAGRPRRSPGGGHHDDRIAARRRAVVEHVLVAATCVQPAELGRNDAVALAGAALERSAVDDLAGRPARRDGARPL